MNGGLALAHIYFQRSIKISFLLNELIVELIPRLNFKLNEFNKFFVDAQNLTE